MHAVLVSSPGSGGGVHWSHAFAGSLAGLLRARGDDVTWLAVSRADPQLVVAPGSEAPKLVRMPPEAALSHVAAESRLLAIEAEVARVLRVAGRAAVVHVGIGARGSPNLGWLTERMGGVAFAVARAAEVVCHRGDLVDRDGRVCHEFLDPARCQRCCAGRWRRPHAVDFANRSDLLVASLQACRSVFVPTAADAEGLTAFGVSPRAIVVTADPASVAARLAP